MQQATELCITKIVMFASLFFRSAILCTLFKKFKLKNFNAFTNMFRSLLPKYILKYQFNIKLLKF